MRLIVISFSALIFMFASCNSEAPEPIRYESSGENLESYFRQKGYIVPDLNGLEMFTLEAQQNLVSKTVCFRPFSFDLFKDKNSYYIMFDVYNHYPNSGLIVEAQISEHNALAIKDSVKLTESFDNFFFCVEIDSIIKTHIENCTFYGTLIEFETF